MFWYPNTDLIPTLGLVWPSGIATTSFTLAALVACARLLVLVLRGRRAGEPAVSVPRESLDFTAEQEVTKTAA